MAILTESKRLGDWLKYEQENHYSRDIVTILAGSGAVLWFASLVAARRGVSAASTSAMAQA